MSTLRLAVDLVISQLGMSQGRNGFAYNGGRIIVFSFLFYPFLKGQLLSVQNRWLVVGFQSIAEGGNYIGRQEISDDERNFSHSILHPNINTNPAFQDQELISSFFFLSLCSSDSSFPVLSQ